jgi:Flp pilus assembly protein protease CpaA
MLVVAMLVAGVLQALLGKEISNWVVLAIAVAGAVAYDLQRRRINTIDLSKSRDISLK